MTGPRRRSLWQPRMGRAWIALSDSNAICLPNLRWSPDGTHLIYSAASDGRNHLFLVRIFVTRNPSSLPRATSTTSSRTFSAKLTSTVQTFRNRERLPLAASRFVRRFPLHSTGALSAHGAESDLRQHDIAAEHRANPPLSNAGPTSPGQRPEAFYLRA